ncbi:MAG: hypothetical protein KatS3mg016_1002 [Fimbriimonadales bacterium]|nr:MAG: hypothetical protein KatS3mg016_1002 [Fimbriimonadales bacterium]
MRRLSIGLGLAALAVLLHGCGGNGGGGGAGIVVTDRVAYVRVVDPTTGNPIPNAEVYFMTDTGAIPLQRVVATTTGSANEIALTIARAVKSDARAGDFMLRNVGDNLFFRGLWVRPPAGYTAIVRHTDLQNNKRVIQTPNTATTTAACLVASNQAGLVRTVFGAPKLIDFGTIEIFPNNPQIPPPPVDDVCP